MYPEDGFENVQDHEVLSVKLDFSCIAKISSNQLKFTGVPKNDPEEPEQPIRPTVVKGRSLFSGQNPS